jgi:hypothetical protein
MTLKRHCGEYFQGVDPVIPYSVVTQFAITELRITEIFLLDECYKKNSF